MGKLQLRKAAEGDCLFILDLANDPECRANSFDKKKILLEDHVKWFDRILNSKTDSLYVLMEDRAAVGQARLELRENACRISYSLIPARRGCGYGKKLITLLMQKAIQDYPGCSTFYAEVLVGNVASQRIFEDLLFIEKKHERSSEILVYVIDREGIANISAVSADVQTTNVC